MSVVKPNLGPHAGRANNPLGFQETYEHVQANPKRTYRTTGNQTPFVVVATTAKRGEHANANEHVLRFMGKGKERARAYGCCWGHITNCNSTHIDIYTEAIRMGYLGAATGGHGRAAPDRPSR